jgi:glycosyltransferase involved in cell wall biosynthesis
VTIATPITTPRLVPSMSAVQKLHVIHIFPELSLAGAEIVMLNLIRGTSESLRHHVITSNVSEFSFLAQVREAGAEISILPSFRSHPIRFIKEMRTIISNQIPSIVHSWMYLANIASIAVPHNIPVVWSFHGEKLSHRLLPWMAELSLVPVSYFFPSTIVFPSRATWSNYRRAGFKPSISKYIHNPVDTSIFFPDAAAGQSYRQARMFPGGTVIGCAARWHPEKGHLLLFDSLRKALDDGADITLVCAGRNMSYDTVEVKDALRARALENRVILVGLETNMREFYNSVDLMVVPSLTEAFGNVIVEAYACGVPVVSTRCGGPLEIIASPECIVPIGDVQSLASALHRFADGLWRPSTEKLVNYAGKYSLARIGKKYINMYRQLA